MSRPNLMAHATAAATLVMACATYAQSDNETQSAMPLAGATLPAETLREGRFRILDLNGDEFLTHDEIGAEEPVVKSQFSSLDWNKDGRLSEAEFVSNGRPRDRALQ